MGRRFVTGTVSELEVPGGKRAWTVMLARRPYLAFYRFNPLGLTEVLSDSAEPLFIVAVYQSVVKELSPPLGRLDPYVIPDVPKQFIQDALYDDTFYVMAPDGTRETASREAVSGMERAAVWEYSGLMARLADTLD